jgi:hypothetical protein
VWLSIRLLVLAGGDGGRRSIHPWRADRRVGG